VPLPWVSPHRPPAPNFEVIVGKLPVWIVVSLQGSALDPGLILLAVDGRADHILL